jgi:putative heme-binding domain-containing protein
LADKLRELNVVFGDGRALDEVRRIALDSHADLQHRRAALETLITSRPDDLREICESLLGARFLNSTAVKGLAGFGDPAIGVKLARSYGRFHHSERPAVIETLVSRPEFATALLREMSRERIPRGDLSAFQARQIQSFGDPQLTELLSEVWGELRQSELDRQQAAADLKSQLTTSVLAAANLVRGRGVYNKLCANCHRLYGHGGEIGPDLTGSGRQNLDYLLENLIDPSAVVGAEYRMSVVALADGRIVNGIAAARTDRTISLQTATEVITVPRSEVESIAASKLSLMPDGQLQGLSPEEVRDLIAYLLHPVQVSE